MNAIVCNKGKGFVAGSFQSLFSEEETTSLNNIVRSQYGKVARDISNAMYEVCSFINNTLNISATMGVKTSMHDVIEAITMSSLSGNTLDIGLAQYRDGDNVSIFAGYDIITPEQVMEALDSFITKTNNKELRRMKASLSVFMRGLVAGNAYGSIKSNDDFIMFYIGRFESDDTPFDAIIKLSNK